MNSLKKSETHELRIKRVYEPSESNDGFRILVDRLWPRGMNKEKAHIDIWLKEIAPSNDLRKWFNHEPGKWKEFVEKYHEELRRSEPVNEIMKLIKKHKIVTLLYAASDTKKNNALALQGFLQNKIT
ncbi:MAG: DUF488 domain-containing protein [Bacteroidota bacterium]|nr:DUF488 domain-containing protein [Bacteroidota bacterium]